MEYELKVTQQELNTIVQALGEFPMKLTLNLFLKLQDQVRKQDADKAAPIPPDGMAAGGSL